MESFLNVYVGFILTVFVIGKILKTSNIFILVYLLCFLAVIASACEGYIKTLENINIQSGILIVKIFFFLIGSIISTYFVFFRGRTV